MKTISSISRSRIRNLLFLQVVMLLAACASVSRMGNGEHQIGAEEAIVLARVAAPEAGTISLSPTTWDAPVAGQSEIPVVKGDNLLVLKVKKGKQNYLTRYHANGSSFFAWFKKSPFVFVAKDAGMTYVGDFVITPDIINRKTAVNLYDNEMRTIELFKGKHPELFERHQFHKEIAEPATDESLF